MPDRVAEPAEIAGVSGDPRGLASLERELEESERRCRTLDGQVRILETERQRFSAIVNHSEVGFVLLDGDGQVLWVNAFFRGRFEASARRDPLGIDCNQALCRKAAVCPECPVARLLKTGTVTHHEFSILAGDRFQHVYATAIPVRGADGELRQALVMLQDLSDLRVLRHSEEALRTTEQRFRSIFEQAGAGMVTMRADGSFLQVNPALCRMLGYSESELIRKKLTDIAHADDAPAVGKWLGEARAGRQQVVEVELRCVRRDGTAVWCYSTTVWQFDRENKPTHAVALIQDISERKRAEIALEQSQRRYETLVHSIDGIVWEADPRAFRFFFVSRQAARVLGHPPERWVSQPRFWRNLLHPQDLERAVKALVQAVDERRSYEIEYRMVAAEGRTVWIRDYVSPVIEDGAVTKLRGLMVDITERKQAEEALRQSEEQLRQSQKMEAIGRLAGGIAHDFNNLLTAITGYGEFLRNKLGDGHPLRREADEIAKAAARAADLTRQLLAFSRQQVLQPKRVDLKQVVDDMQMMLRRVIGEHIELVTSLESGRGAVLADPGQMNQVLLNLAVNARDAMPEGGRLIIETGEVELAEDYAARHPGVSPGPYVTLAVIDSGSGMDERTMARLFEPFFTTKEQGKGTGLGLSTVYGIVKQSGGHIAVDSVPGQGSTFRIYLPMVERADEPVVHRDPAPEMTPGTETILLVEDDDSVRELAREVLEMSGYTVFEAPNGAEALVTVESRAKEIDLLVTDLVMPRMGGRDLARKVAPILPELPVLYLSGYADAALIQQGELDGGAFFLQKPFTPAALAAKIREVLDSSRAHP